MSTLHLFDLLNAGPGLCGWHLIMALALAQDLVFCLPLVMAWAWVAGNHASRRELLHLLLSAAMALALAQVVSHVWPQPRPFTLHLGNQYLAHGNDPGLPTRPVTLFWSLAIAAFARGSRRPFLPATARMLSLYDRLARWPRAALPHKHTQMHKHKA